MEQFLKDADEVLDYQVDWSNWLAAGETITTSTWVVPSGLTAGTDSHSTTTATQWISGGTVGTKYVVANTIMTSAGRTGERRFQLALVMR
jgi:hypothetical protein